MSNRFIYIQNCLQQDFWINNDPRGVIGVQVHNTICTKVSSQQKKEKKRNPLRAPWVLKGCRWSLKNCKAQDTASATSLRPSSNTPSIKYLLIKAFDIKLKLPTPDTWGKSILSFHLCNANRINNNNKTKEQFIAHLKHLTVINQGHNIDQMTCISCWLGFMKPWRPAKNYYANSEAFSRFKSYAVLKCN